MSSKLLTPDVKIMQVDNGHAAGTTAVTTSIVDCSGYDGVCFVASLGTVTAGCVEGLQPQDNSLNQTGGMANVGTPATYTDTAGESSNKLLIADVTNVQKRYVQAVLTRTTSNAVVNNILAILYRTKKLPVTQDASVQAIAQSNATS